MKLKNKLVLAAVALPLVIGSTSAFALGGKDGHKGKRGCGPNLDRGVIKQLDLTQEQKDQLQQMRKENKVAMTAAKQDNKQARQMDREQMQQLVLAKAFDAKAANTLAQKMAEKQVQKRVDMMKKRHDMLNVLTPVQKAQYSKLVKEKVQQCRA